MREILIPTDFSEEAMKSYKVAASIAKRNGFGIHLFHITRSHMDELSYWVSGVYNTPKSSSIDEMRQLSFELDRHEAFSCFNDVKTRTSISKTDSDPAVKTVDEINKKEYELVVIGESKDADDHSFSSLLTRYTGRPMLVVKNKIRDLKVNKTLVVLDLDQDMALLTQSLDKYCVEERPNYDFLFVNTSANFRTTKDVVFFYNQLVKETGMLESSLLIENANSVSEGVLEIADKREYDNIAMASERKTMWKYFFLNSDLENVLQRCDQSLFVVNLDHFHKSPAFSQKKMSTEELIMSYGV